MGMRLLIRWPVLWLAMLLALPVLTLTMLEGQARAGEECAILLQNRCSTCHFVNYICPKMEKNSGSVYWKWVMRSMIKEGALLTDQEQSLLVDCLSSHNAQAKSFCPEKK